MPELRNTSPYEMFLQLARDHVPRHRFQAGRDVLEWRSETLPGVLATLGRRPAPVDPRPELLAEWQQDGVIVQRWLIDVSPGLSAFVYLNRPVDLPAGARPPGILCWHGHSAGGKEAVIGNITAPEVAADVQRTRTDYGLRMAQHGFVTFAIDWMGYGDQDDRQKPNHRHLDHGRDWCNLYYLQATMLGMTSLGINLAHGRALVDFVLGLGLVDPDRLGVMGLSGGGTMTLWSALTDSRLKAAEIICYSDLFSVFGFRDINYCGMQITPGLFDLVDLPDLQGLLAPRPLLIDIGIHDECFRLESAMSCYSRVAEIYAAAGAADRLELDRFP
ncbi:MAG TPA: alpha/beta hydrolase family protein, partial [Mycobacteriales bacterium]|nr:alpha/beta hydrolase family protein [Mycobacteriales bacterium]